MTEYSICKCIRTDKPQKRNGKYPIYLRIRVGTKETKVPTKLDVFKTEWDNKFKQPKCKALLILLNKKIMELDLYINRCMADGRELNIDLVKAYYSKKSEDQQESQSFYTYYLDFVDRKAKDGLNPETVRVYMTTYRMMKKFRAELKISDISLETIEKFDEYMRDVNGNTAGGRQPKHKNLRSVILDIQKHKIPIDNPYMWFKMSRGVQKEIYLERVELDKLIKYSQRFEKDTTEYRVLQMYLFSCYCGLRFSDALDLEWGHIDFKNNLIRKVMIKTKTEVITPIFPMAQDILLERMGLKKSLDATAKVFTKYSEPTVNQALRKHTKLAGIDKHITYHTSRHTFATLLVIDGVNIYNISKYLGHSSVNMTQRYLKYDLSIAKKMAEEIDTFSGESKK